VIKPGRAFVLTKLDLTQLDPSKMGALPEAEALLAASSPYSTRWVIMISRHTSPRDSHKLIPTNSGNDLGCRIKAWSGCDLSVVLPS